MACRKDHLNMSSDKLCEFSDQNICNILQRCLDIWWVKRLNPLMFILSSRWLDQHPASNMAGTFFHSNIHGNQQIIFTPKVSPCQSLRSLIEAGALFEVPTSSESKMLPRFGYSNMCGASVHPCNVLLVKSKVNYCGCHHIFFPVSTVSSSVQW